MPPKNYAMGLDFGTNSVRALIVDVADGRELAGSVADFRGGEDGVIVDGKNDLLARQDPGDWLYALEKAAKGAVKRAKKDTSFVPEAVIGIGVAATGSTPLPLDKNGVPLAFHKRFAKNPNAMAWLWKDHTSYEEAEEITALAGKMRPDYLKRCGGAYSSEWFWAKILHCLRTDRKVFDAAFTWAECSDYIPFLLSGGTQPETMSRNVCAAGHKAMYSDDWGGLPDSKFLKKLAPEMAELRNRLYEGAVTSDKKAGRLSPEWAKRMGLVEGTTVAVGAIDAHLGAVGAGVRPGTLAKIIGTSTCDMMVAPASRPLPDIEGISGIVKGSIIPGMWGLEAGQAAVGDIFNWYVSRMSPKGKDHPELTSEALDMKPGESGLLALDWNNGNRSVLLDHRLTGLLVGQTLHTTPAEVYRALIEATAFGARKIVVRVEDSGVKISGIVNCGGISEKNALLLQIYADVLGRPMKIARSAQTVALGACMMAAAAAGKKRGGHSSVKAAQKTMGGLKTTVFKPIAKNRKVYEELYGLYNVLHDSFGGVDDRADLSPVMKKLLEIKDRQSRS